MATTQKLDEIAKTVAEYWPKSIDPDQLSDPDLIASIHEARTRLLDICRLSELDR